MIWTPYKAAVVIDTLRFLAQGWVSGDDNEEWCLRAAEEIEGYDFHEGGFTCPLCHEVVCDGGCPFEELRQ